MLDLSSFLFYTCSKGFLLKVSVCSLANVHLLVCVCVCVCIQADVSFLASNSGIGFCLAFLFKVD